MQWKVDSVFLVFRLKQAKVIIKMINLSPVAGVKHLMVTHLSHTPNA